MRRDRVIWQLYIVMCAWAFYLNALAPSITFLRNEQGTSATVAGLHGFGMGLGMFLAGVIGPGLSERWGRSRVLWDGSGVMALGSVVIATGGVPWITIPAVVCATAGGTIACNAVMSGLADYRPEHGAAAVSEANSLGAVAAGLAPGVLALSVWLTGWWDAALLTAAALVALTALLFRRIWHTPIPESATGHQQRTSLQLPRQYWSAWGTVVACCSIEFAFTIWVADGLRENTRVSAALAAVAVSVTLAGLASGRLLSARWADRFTLDTMLYIGVGCILVGFWIFWLSSIAVIAFLGIFLVGIGIGPMYPLSVLRAARRVPHAADRAVQRTSLGSGAAIAVGPLLIGVLADAVGVRGALLVVPACALLAAGAVYLSRIEARVEAKVSARV